MRRTFSLFIGVIGLWFLVPGLLSLTNSPAAGTSIAPAMGTNVVLGAAFLAGSVLLWRRRARHGTDVRSSTEQ